MCTPFASPAAQAIAPRAPPTLPRPCADVFAAVVGGGAVAAGER
ncbi:folate-binding protein, partial [Burkholderia pseudomallei]